MHYLDWQIIMDLSTWHFILLGTLAPSLGTFIHKLLIEKPNASDLDLNAVSFIKSCLTNRYLCCKIGNSFSKWEKIIAGVPQGPLPLPLSLGAYFLTSS